MLGSFYISWRRLVRFSILSFVLLGFSSISNAGWHDVLNEATKQVEKSLSIEPGKEETEGSETKSSPGNGKLDSAEIAKRHGFNNADALNLFIGRDLNFVFGGEQEKWADQDLYKKISSMYKDVKDYDYRDFEGSDTNFTRMLMQFKDIAERYFDNREAELASLKEWRNRKAREEEEENRRAEEEEREIALEEQRQEENARKERAEAPGQIVSQFRDSPRPGNAAKIKGWIDLLSEWKIGVFKRSGEWFVETTESSSGTGSDELVFDRPPIDASPYSKKYILVSGSIDRKYGDNYIISSFWSKNKETIAIIPSDIVSDSGVAFGENCYMICTLVDVVNVETVGGTSKPISKLKVKGIVNFEDYQEFCNYVLGHPGEFPQQKYVEILW